MTLDCCRLAIDDAFAALAGFGLAAIGAILVRLAMYNFRGESGLFHSR